ncbi:FkbM family methyltransferase [Helicobacter sp. MIT 21-1697]|uniref:FkbM family methyltransferase n=1 Tax=Helicobacter sp. MIT 21-1697 TaxID=2993733 RepID=UPI00224A8C1B|nr:FkbM family methyltransferase [Helicobacter sp. MIT 21-1697]MCX2716543.1 FkbM family methyltransferase [Helicobacter sp. MIT 21-1697]
MIYYSFNEPALNGFTPILENKYKNHPHFYLVEKIPMPVKKLEQILDEYLLPNQHRIDFLNIDVEGLDLEVLQSNNWLKYRPGIILVESWESDFENIYNNKIYTFLATQGYKLCAKTLNTLIFKNQQC